jgi:hypothetical protein
VLYGVNINGTRLVDTPVVLTVAGNDDIVDMSVGDTVVEVNGGGDGGGKIAEINATSPPYTVTLDFVTGTWTPGASIKVPSVELSEEYTPLISTDTITAVNPGTAGTIGTIQYKNSSGGDPNPGSAQNVVYGKVPQDNALSSSPPAGTYPMFEWAQSLNTAVFNGFSDWYIPAKNEQEIIYRNLKPTTTPNVTTAGTNANAVPAATGNYTTSNPSQTTAQVFKAGGAQAFETSNIYWNATEFSSDTRYSWRQGFGDGGISADFKVEPRYARAIRRISIANYINLGSPAIGTFIAGGFYAGQISTGGTGVADFALIVAPNVGGEFQSSAGTNATLAINGANTDGFVIGNAISNGVTGASAATGVIGAITGTTVTLVGPSATNWANGQYLYRGQTIVNSSGDTNNLTSLLVPQASLSPSNTYQARVRYNSVNNPPVYSSTFSAWSGFATAASFVLAPGTSYGGGY